MINEWQFLQTCVAGRVLKNKSKKPSLIPHWGTMCTYCNNTVAKMKILFWLRRNQNTNVVIVSWCQLTTTLYTATPLFVCLYLNEGGKTEKVKWLICTRWQLCRCQFILKKKRGKLNISRLRRQKQDFLHCTVKLSPMYVTSTQVVCCAQVSDNQ